MKINNTLLLLFFVLSSGYCQQAAEKMQAFQVLAPGMSVEGINIVNLSTESYTKSDAEGFFKIQVKAGDLLVLTSIGLEVHRKIIEKSDLDDNLIIIKMIPKVTELAETRVNQYSHINAEALGIIPVGQKKYTPAERRLQTAGDFKPIHLLALLGGSLQVDPIINAITGRTAMLKKELSVEKKEHLLAKLDHIFSVDFYINKLAIPEENVPGFKQYVVEYRDFDQILMSDNMMTIRFALTQLAVQYNQIISIETK